jgi:hypothetical protein
MSEEVKNEPTLTEERIKEILSLTAFSKQIAKKDFFYNLMSPKVDELTKALTEFKKSVPDLKTDKAAGGRYKYQSLPGLLSAITKPLAQHGCTVMQLIHSLGEKTYVITILLHTSGQYIRSVTVVPERYLLGGKLVETAEHLQAKGGALTYTKRHALKSLLGIDADDDTDGGATYSR